MTIRKRLLFAVIFGLPYAGVVLNVQADTPSQKAYKACKNYSAQAEEDFKKHQKDVRSRVVARVYDENDQLCDTSDVGRLSEGDIVVIGYMLPLPPSIKNQYSLEKETCEQESPDHRIRDEFRKQTDAPDGTPGVASDSGKSHFELVGVLDCYGPQVSYKVKKEKTVTIEETFSQFLRYRGTWQIGAVWTDDKDTKYTVKDFGTGNVIHADKDDSTGPEYVASLTIYGFPYYLKTLKGDRRYSGRDIINQNGFLDRVGLNFSFGIEHPTDTFGMGLSFELVPGINLTYSRLFREIEELDGVKEGDSISTTTIPTKDVWNDNNVWGVSIDGRYIAKFFGFSENN